MTHNIKRPLMHLAVLFVTSMYTVSVLAQASVPPLNTELKDAINRDDLNNVKFLIEKRCVDPNAVVSIAASGNKTRAIHIALYRRNTSLEYPKPKVEIVRYLLESGAKLDPDQNVMYSAGLAGVEYWLDAVRRAVNDDNPYTDNADAQASLPHLQAVVELLRNPPQVVRRNTDCGQVAQEDEEVVNTSDWVEDGPAGVGKTIYIRNNSRAERIRITELNVYQCENVGSGGCGVSTNIAIILPGQAVAVRLIPPQSLNNTSGMSFLYKYWAEFVK